MDKNIDFGTVADLYDVYVQWDSDVSFFRERCANVTGKVLELMCGTGRLSIPLLQSGIQLSCVDYSAEMLRVFERRLQEHHLNADVYEADVRNLNLGRSHELILLPFHSFSEIVHPNDRNRALASIRRHLAPDGRFVITFHNPAVQVPRLDGCRRQICDRPIPGHDTTLRVWSTVSARTDQGIAEGIQEYEIVGADGRPLERRELQVRFAITDRSTFEKEAADAGFRVLRLWGDYASNAFEPEKSPHMIWELGIANVGSADA
jgi:SAM-dependent methyltransferase